MTLFHESDLEQLRVRFPLRDVDRMADDVAEKHAKSPFRIPIAMLRKWLETSEKKDTHRLDEAQPKLEATDGMFRADGSWDDKGHGDPDSHRFVDMLVTARRRDYTPLAMAERILEQPDTAAAFPHVAAWLSSSDWAHCPCSTSAEQCVKDAGRGSAHR